MVLPSASSRACDRCHAHKVKCDGRTPCGRCIKLSCPCAINRPLRPKGPTPRARSRPDRLAVRPKPSPKQFGSQTPRSDIPALDTSFLESDLASALFGTPSTSNQVPSDTTLPNLESSINSTEPWWQEWTMTVPTGSNTPLRALEESCSTPQSDIFDLTRGLDLFSQCTMNPILANRTDSIIPGPSPLALTTTISDDPSPIFTLTFDTLIRPQLEIYFQRIYPMLPVYPREYIFDRLDDPISLQTPDFLAVVLAMVALSLIHPLYGGEMMERGKRVKQSKTLLDEACRLTARWNHGANTSLDLIFTTYLIFGVNTELGFADATRLRLNEAMNLALSMRLHESSTYAGLSTIEAQCRRRMFLVLCITERAHCLQRDGNVIYPGRICDEAADVLTGISCPSLQNLSKIFDSFDGPTCICWNNQCDVTRCTNWTKEKATEVLSRLKGTPQEVFGDIDLAGMTDSQRSDLMVTWQWMRNRLWKLSAAHGLASEDGPPELSTSYVVDVASTTVDICRQLSLQSMEAHGAGFVQKLYDIASIVTNLLQSDLHLQGELLAIAQTDMWANALRALYHLVAQHRKGKDEFALGLSRAVSAVSNIKLLLDTAS